VVRGGLDQSNPFELTPNCTSGQLPPSSSSQWFEGVRCGRTVPKLTRTFPVGMLPPTSQWFGEVRCSRTSSNSLQTALQASFPLHHSGSKGFGVVEPPRTQSNLPCKACIPLHHSSSRRFGVFEPPQTHSNLPCGPASPFVTVIRGGSVYSNLPRLTRTIPVGLLPPTSQWFEEVRCSRTSSNSLQTA